MNTELEKKIDIAKKLAKLLKGYQYVEFIACSDGGSCVEIDNNIINFDINGNVENTIVGL